MFQQAIPAGPFRKRSGLGPDSGFLPQFHLMLCDVLRHHITGYFAGQTPYQPLTCSSALRLEHPGMMYRTIR